MDHQPAGELRIEIRAFLRHQIPGLADVAQLRHRRRLQQEQRADRRPRSGSAQVLGIDAGVDPMQVRRRVGYMPEVDAYLPGLTGAESVLFAGVMCGMPRRHARQRAHEILYYVGLGEARYRKVEQYSTGMRQRLRMAQALIHDPELIFLDEPAVRVPSRGGSGARVRRPRQHARRRVGTHAPGPRRW